MKALKQVFKRLIPTLGLLFLCAAGEQIAALHGMQRFSFIGCAAATTVMQVDFDTLAKRAAFIFEGRVRRVSTQLDPGTGAIWTTVSFDVLEVVKGRRGQEAVELQFLGGTHGSHVMHVAGMTPPEAGEEGIYFVESLEHRQAHPLYGWSQGHFVVRRDGLGERRVGTWDGGPVVSIDVAAVAENRATPPGVVRGVRVGGNSPAMSATDFKRAIRARTAAP